MVKIRNYIPTSEKRFSFWGNYCCFTKKKKPTTPMSEAVFW